MVPLRDVGGTDPLATAWHAEMDARAAARVPDPARGGPPIPAQASPLSPFTGVSRGTARYVGDAVCAACHPTAAATLAATPHAHALATLREARAAANPSCFTCHVTGYGHPGGWDPRRSPAPAVSDTLPDVTSPGRALREGAGPLPSHAEPAVETRDLAHVGCEACHGPGSDHVAGPPVRGVDRDDLRLPYGGLPADGSACVACHTHDTSPDFRWELRWPHLAHGHEPR